MRLRLSDEEFWKLTVRRYWLLRKAHDQAFSQFELLAGIIASVVSNSGVRAPEKAAVPADFMPSMREGHRSADLPAEVQLADLRTVFRALAKKG